MPRSMGFHDSRRGADLAQAELWHDTILDACGTVVQSIGGIKRAASLLWPNDPLSRAEQRLRECLNGDRPQHFAPDELLRLMRLGRESCNHSIMNYLADAIGYTRSSPVDPEDQRAELERQAKATTAELKSLVARLERLMQANGLQPELDGFQTADDGVQRSGTDSAGRGARR